MGCGNFTCILADVPRDFALGCLGTPSEIQAFLGDTHWLRIPWAPTVCQALGQEPAALGSCRDTPLPSGQDTGQGRKQEAPPDLGESAWRRVPGASGNILSLDLSDQQCGSNSNQPLSVGVWIFKLQTHAPAQPSACWAPRPTGFWLRPFASPDCAISPTSAEVTCSR